MTGWGMVMDISVMFRSILVCINQYGFILFEDNNLLAKKATPPG